MNGDPENRCFGGLSFDRPIIDWSSVSHSQSRCRCSSSASRSRDVGVLLVARVRRLPRRSLQLTALDLASKSAIFRKTIAGCHKGGFRAPLRSSGARDRGCGACRIVPRGDARTCWPPAAAQSREVADHEDEDSLYGAGEAAMGCGALFQCGSGFLSIDAPYLGLPGVDQDPHGCCDQRPAGERQPSVFSLSDAPQGPGQLPGVLGEVATAVADLRQRFRLRIPGILDGPAIVNPANRNVVFQLAVPSTGPFAPRALLTYNSMARCQVMNPYGAKWRLLFEQQVIERGEDDAVVIKGDGSCWRYTDLDAESQFYLAPDGACNSLERTDDGWLETQPDGLELHYEELEDDQQQPSGVGRLATLARHDQVWTLSYDQQALLESITDPYNRRTTFTYSDGYLTTITDHAGRETGFQIDGCCLKSVTFPESTVTSFVYDARGRVLCHVAPGGSRTSYSYDCCGRVETITTPLGEVTTFTQADGLHTRITDARGHITTLTFDEEDCHLASVTDPLGHVTTYSWHGNRVSGVVDANEHDTHLDFTTLANRTQSVSAIVYDNGDTYSINRRGRQSQGGNTP